MSPSRLAIPLCQGVRQIMASRVEKAASMSCDGIEPDNMSVRKGFCDGPAFLLMVWI